MSLQKKVEGFRKQFKDKKLDGVLVTSNYNISYLTGYSNFSIEEREAYLLITSDKAFILTDARYTEAIKKVVPHFELIEINHQNPLKKLISEISKKHNLQIVGIEENDLKVTEYKFFKKHFKVLKNFETHKSRTIKTDQEIKFIKAVCQIGDKAFLEIFKKIKSGISEKELAAELEMIIKRMGGSLSFDTIIAFGANSSIPHHQTGEKILKEKNGQFILLDFGVKYKNYCSDMTRTVFFGQATEKQKKIYQIVSKAQKKAVDFINKNSSRKIKLKDVDKVAREYIIKAGFPSIPHSLGHGIGLQVHEHPSLSPKSKDILRPGMIFSIEPGIYIEKFGGVRIEDLFVYRNNKLEQITSSSNKLIEL